MTHAGGSLMFSAQYTLIQVMAKPVKQTSIIPADHAGLRLDRSLALLFPEYSRARLQDWIANQRISVDGQFRANRYPVTGGEQVELRPVEEDQNPYYQPENIPLEIVFEDPHLMVINKPAGLVVHPGAGNARGTLLNALLHHHDSLRALPRAGIVHRLDKDTSGLMVVAKSMTAHSHLVNQLQARVVERCYYAFVRGPLIGGGVIEQPIGRHPHERTKMAVSAKGKPACTHFKVLEKFTSHTWLEARLETGRTHQIRVHFAHIKHPLVGDNVYASGMQKVANAPCRLNESLAAFPRQALHAFKLSFQHPLLHQVMKWQADMPKDMQELLRVLRQYSSA